MGAFVGGLLCLVLALAFGVGVAGVRTFALALHAGKFVRRHPWTLVPFALALFALVVLVTGGW